MMFTILMIIGQIRIDRINCSLYFRKKAVMVLGMKATVWTNYCHRTSPSSSNISTH